MNTGLDQVVSNQLASFSLFIQEKEFLAEEKSELYALSCLKRAIGSAAAFLNAARNETQMVALRIHLTALDQKIRSLAKLHLDLFKEELSVLLKTIEENSRLNQDANCDKLLKDVVVLEKSEFGNDYDHFICDLMYKNDVPYLNPRKTHSAPIRFSSSMLPGFASTPEEYEKIFTQYKGCVDVMPTEKLRLLIEDLNINLPSNSLILPQKEYVPTQVLVDLPRLSKLIINGNSLLDKTSKEDKDALFCQCVQALEEDVQLSLSILKLVTQATLARPTYIIYTGFQFPETMTRVSHALDVVVSINTRHKGKALSSLEIKMWAYFGLMRGEGKEPFRYLGVMRRLSCPREFLAGQKGKEEVMDVYSPLFERYKSLKLLDFETLGNELKKAKLILKTT